MDATARRAVSARRRPTVRLARLVAALMLVAGPACSSATGPRPGASVELQRNRQRWVTAGMRDYEFDFQRLCFCLPETTESVHIVVRGGAVASVTRRSDGQTASTRATAWPTVDDLFAEVQQRLDQPAERLEVEYDPTYGYPRSIVVDVWLMAADDEYSITAVNLRRLP